MSQDNIAGKIEAELLINRYNELIDLGAQEFDIDLLKEAIKIGEQFNLDVSKITEKLNSLLKNKTLRL